MSEELEPISKRIPNAKWRAFIDELFLQNLNATRAYQNVYDCAYNTARTNGAMLLTNTDIKLEVERRLKENAMDANEVLYRMADMARGSLADFADVKSLDDLKNHPLAHLVKKVKQKTYIQDDKEVKEVEIELHNSQSSLQDLAKFWALFTDKLELSGSVENKLVILPQKDDK